MTIGDVFLPEFEHEMASTRKVLERVPDDKLHWKAHPKSNSIGWNANHLAEIPGWVQGTVANDAWDIHPPGGEPYQSPKLTTTKEILALFDQNVAAGRKALQTASDEQMMQEWKLLQNGQVLIAMPRAAVIRTWVLNHAIHHRGHLCVYLRLNDIPVPAIYGPSGDESGG